MKRGRNQRRRQGMNINRALDSNGPDVRIRGTANQIYDKYLALARDASSSGDRVKAENYLQHAEHYFRMIRALQPPQPQQTDNVDVEGDQPSIEGERQNRRDNAGSGEARAAASDNGGEAGGDSEGAERRPNGAVDGAQASESSENSEPKRPRRRRPRREPQPREASSEEESAADEAEGAEAAAAQ